MGQYPGKFIVIDGTDGSGKTTQVEILIKRFKKAGFDVEIADFPQYNTKSAGLVEEYLSGKYGEANEVTPYQASIFYAVDRYDASKKIRDWLKAGKIVVANRYVSANMGHQGGKIQNSLERKIFFSWLDELEYKIFNIPRPDLSIILHVEAEIAQQLTKQRARTDWSDSAKDIHEKSLDHLKNAEQVYLEIAHSFPDFKLIKCTINDRLLSREEINDLIWVYVKQALGRGDGQKNPSGFKPIAEIITNNPQIRSHKNYFPENEKAKEQAPVEPPLIATTETAPTLETETIENLIVEKIVPEAKLPTRAHDSDAGFDLYALDYYSIPPYQQALIATGLKIKIPDGYAGLIWDKSGLANQGLTTLGGVIDAGYRGEIKIIFKNLSEDIYNVEPGQKIAQLLIQKIAVWPLVEGFVDEDSRRGQNGFGSSGRF
jgi:dTMP kinase